MESDEYIVERILHHKPQAGGSVQGTNGLSSIKDMRNLSGKTPGPSSTISMGTGCPIIRAISCLTGSD